MFPNFVELFWIVCCLFFEFKFLLLEKKLLFLFLRQAFFFYILFKFSTLSGIINKSLNHSYQSWNLFQLPERKKPRFSKVGAEWKTTALEIKKKRAPVLDATTHQKKSPACFKNKTKKTSGNFFSFIQIHQQAGNSLKQFGENSETNNRTKKKKSSWKIENP